MHPLLRKKLNELDRRFVPDFVIHAKRITLRWIEERRNGANMNVFIHIGKCGGSSVRKGLDLQRVVENIIIVHGLTPPVYNKARYYIIIRNPISRAYSAFNYRYKKVVIDDIKKNDIDSERKVLIKYGSLENLALDLFDSEGKDNVRAHKSFNQIHHLNENISYYLTRFLEKVNPDQIAAVLTQENLNRDFMETFGLELEFNENSHSKTLGSYQEPLSDQALKNLKRFLASDYECLMRLRCYGKLSEDVFQQITKWC